MNKQKEDQILRYGGGHGGGYGSSHGGGYGGGHGHSKGTGTGTACIVKVLLCNVLDGDCTKEKLNKWQSINRLHITEAPIKNQFFPALMFPLVVQGSYCNCHYCKCEKGHISCGGYGHGGGYGETENFVDKKARFHSSLILERHQE